MPGRIVSTFIATAAALFFAAPAVASPGVQFGVQDDAWLLGGPGTFDGRLEQVKDLGVDVVRVNIRWDSVARTRPRRHTDHLDPAYRWGAPDALLEGLRRWKITPVVTANIAAAACAANVKAGAACAAASVTSAQTST